MKVKPIVGVMPLWDEEKKSIWMLPGYMDAISEAGGIPLIFPLSSDREDLDRLMNMCDGFLLTGGQDVSPEIYGEKPLPFLSDYCINRDTMETVIFEKIRKTGRPLLGICRGIQFINAVMGGTLYQDIPTQHPSDTEHHQSAPYDIPVHEVEVVKDSPLYRCLNIEKLSVNSCHHQAIKKVADGLEIMAVSEDGLVEAVCMPQHKFLWGIQWHPEYSFKSDINSRMIFNEFLRYMNV